jgi:predicted amidohydrolase YtcJ
VLDAFEAALRGSNTNVSALRPRLEHAQIMTKADMERLGSLGGVYRSFAIREVEEGFNAHG